MAGWSLKSVTVAALLGMAALAPPATAVTPVRAADAATVETPDDMSMGSATAPITLMIYASVTCRHCAKFNEDILPQIEAKYIKTGKVRYVYREFLTPPNDVSAAGILLARCAGKDKYFQVVDSVMRSQREMFGEGTTENARPVLQRIAQEAGLSPEQFAACVTDDTGLQRLQDNMDRYLTQYDVVATPTFYINGKKFERRTGDFAEFERAFARLGIQ